MGHLTWVDAASAELPDGTVVGAIVGETDLALARAGDGWHAVELWCNHAECPLTDGWIENGALRCACHGALFDLTTGEALEGPTDEPVRVFPTRIVDARVQVDA